MSRRRRRRWRERKESKVAKDGGETKEGTDKSAREN